jgi:hypothetical protein
LRWLELAEREENMQHMGLRGGAVNADVDEAAQALSALRECRAELLCARLAALQASAALSGSRAQRGRELCEKIADAIVHAERVAFFVEGDRC